MHKEIGQGVDLLLTRAVVKVLADRLFERDVDRHSRIGEEALRVGDPVVNVPGPEPLVNDLELRRQRFRVPRRGVGTDEVAFHAVVVVGDDLHRPIQMPRVGRLGDRDGALVETGIVNIRIVGTVHSGEVVHECRRLGGLEVELRHPQHGRRPDRRRIQKKLVEPAGLDFVPLADQRRGEPAPGIVSLGVGIDQPFVSDHHREEQPGQISAMGRVVLAGGDGVGGDDKIRATNDSRSAVDEDVVPEHERTMGNRLGIILLDAHAILVNVLGLPGFGVQLGHPDERRPAAPLTIRDERCRHLGRSEVRGEERIIDRLLPLAERLRAVADVPPVHLESVAAAAVVLLGDFQPGEPGLLALGRRVDELRRRGLCDEPEHERHHRFALGIIEGELRHPVAFVVALVLCFLVVVAAGRAELLPEESLSFVGEEFLEEEPGVGVDRFRRHVGLIRRGVGQIRVEAVGSLRVTVTVMAGAVTVAVTVAGGTDRVVGRGVVGVMTSRTSVSAMTGHDEL